MKKTLALLMLTTLAACSSVDKRDFSGLTTTRAEARLGEFVRLSEKQCPTEPRPEDKAELGPGWLGVLASTGAQFAVDAIDEAIKEYKAGLSGFFMASTPSSAKQLRDARCLIIARGLIGQRSNVAARDGKLESGHLTDLGLADYPAFYLEVELPENDKQINGIALTPSYLSYAASSARSKGSGKKYVSVAIALSGAAIKQQEDPANIVTEENSLAIAYHDLGRLETGKHYTAETLKGTESMLHINDQDLEKNPHFSITTVVTESEDAGVALKAIQSAFDTNKDALKAEFEKLFKEAAGVEK
ncbi:MAG: hypothetical protein ABFS23_03400 [Pseudomonadota bacterium]